MFCCNICFCNWIFIFSSRLTSKWRKKSKHYKLKRKQKEYEGVISLILLILYIWLWAMTVVNNTKDGTEYIYRNKYIKWYKNDKNHLPGLVSISRLNNKNAFMLMILWLGTAISSLIIWATGGLDYLGHDDFLNFFLLIKFNIWI